MQIRHIINVVYMQRSQSVVPENTDGILRFSSAESYVADIETNRKMLGIVQCIVVSRQFVRICAYIVADMAVHRMVLPHVLDADLDAVLIRQRDQRAVKIHIQIEKFFFMTVIASSLKRMYYDLTDSQNFTKGEYTRKLRYQNGCIVIISAAKGGVCLIEYHPVSIHLMTDTAGGVLPVISKEIVIMIEQGYVDTGIARFYHNVDGSVKSQTLV